MKKAFLMLMVVISLVSCKKDYPAIPTLNGTWELDSVLGGFGPSVVIAADKKDKYDITVNSRYIRTAADKTQTIGNYILNLTEEHNGYRLGTITFSNPQYTDAVAIKADTLIIGSSAADGPSYKYVRIKK